MDHERGLKWLPFEINCLHQNTHERIFPFHALVSGMIRNQRINYVFPIVRCLLNHSSNFFSL